MVGILCISFIASPDILSVRVIDWNQPQHMARLKLFGKIDASSDEQSDYTGELVQDPTISGLTASNCITDSELLSGFLK
jgi:hypothetical protein